MKQTAHILSAEHTDLRLIPRVEMSLPWFGWAEYFGGFEKIGETVDAERNGFAETGCFHSTDRQVGLK